MPIWGKRIVFFVLVIIASGVWGVVSAISGVPDIFIPIGAVLIVAGAFVNYWPK